MPELEPKKIIALLGLLMPPVNFSHPYSNRIPFHVIHGCRKTPRIAAGCVFNGMLIHGKKGRSKPKKGNWRTNVASDMRAALAILIRSLILWTKHFSVSETHNTESRPRKEVGAVSFDDAKIAAASPDLYCRLVAGVLPGHQESDLAAARNLHVAALSGAQGSGRNLRSSSDDLECPILH